MLMIRCRPAWRSCRGDTSCSKARRKAGLSTCMYLASTKRSTRCSRRSSSWRASAAGGAPAAVGAGGKGRRGEGGEGGGDVVGGGVEAGQLPFQAHEEGAGGEVDVVGGVDDVAVAACHELRRPGHQAAAVRAGDQEDGGRGGVGA